jgi:hypothetical protein
MELALISAKVSKLTGVQESTGTDFIESAVWPIEWSHGHDHANEQNKEDNVSFLGGGRRTRRGKGRLGLGERGWGPDQVGPLRLPLVGVISPCLFNLLTHIIGPCRVVPCHP